MNVVKTSVWGGGSLCVHAESSWGSWSLPATWCSAFKGGFGSSPITIAVLVHLLPLTFALALARDS